MKFNELKKLVDEKEVISKGRDTYLKNLNVILDVVKTINRTLILDDVLQLVLKYAIELTGTERGFIVLINNDEKLEYKIGLDASGNRLTENLFKLSSTVIKEVFNSGESRFIEYAQSDANYDQSKSIVNLELQTILCSPLIVGSKKIGVLYVDSKLLSNILTSEVTNIFEILTGQAAIAIQNAKLYNDQINAFESIQKTNEQLVAAKEKAEQSDKLKSNLLANLSHEFRTPLHGIIGYVKLIGDELGQISSEAMLKSINELSKRLLFTLDEILQYSELESKSIIPNWKNVDLDELIKPIISQFSDLAENKELEIRYVSLKKKPIVFPTDHYILSKAIEYIVDNAIKFTQTGYIKIQTTIESKGKNKFCVIKIIDTGIGIDENDFEIIYLPFRQVSEGLSRGFEGSGLGLTISKRFIELIDGKLSVESTVGKGSTFTITIPIQDKQIKKEIRKPIFRKKITARIPKILLVEDDKENIDVIERFLKGKYDVESVNTGSDALKLAEQRVFDLILMDLNLGEDMDGFETTKLLRKHKNYKRTPIIAITGYALAGDEEKIIDAGCNLYLPKPFTKERLLSQINSCFVTT